MPTVGVFQNHIPVKIREDLMLNTIEVIFWWEAAIDRQVLTVRIWITCEMLDNVCDINREVYSISFVI